MTSHYIPHMKIPTLVFPTSTQASRHVALMIESLIRQNNSAGRPTVLGLATGSTPVGLYRELIRLHKEADLDFSRVITFNLDEYHPMTPDDSHSYNLWMHEMLFKHINIKPENIHIPDGMTPTQDIEEYCARYEQMIRRAGGIDLQILGIGRSGHIGFNEPGSTRHSRTRAVTLDPVTREVTREGTPVALGPKEFAILQALLSRPGAVLSRAQLEEKLYGWGEEIESNAVEVYVHGLRRKLGGHFIRNIRGVGYMVPKSLPGEPA
jgi:6-phosphogluconolactonase/glucosamine-6-phosphate isomerase/deaminase